MLCNLCGCRLRSLLSFSSPGHWNVVTEVREVFYNYTHVPRVQSSEGPRALYFREQARHANWQLAACPFRVNKVNPQKLSRPIIAKIGAFEGRLLTRAPPLFVMRWDLHVDTLLVGPLIRVLRMDTPLRVIDAYRIEITYCSCCYLPVFSSTPLDPPPWFVTFEWTL
jgi:hypothetical protein